jgi:predicted DNA-binding ribbon-helix-helix protein
MAVAMEQIFQSGQNHEQQAAALVSKNVRIGKHRTSIRLEPEMWAALRVICQIENSTLHKICTDVHSRMSRGLARQSLTSAIRVFILQYYVAHLEKQNGPASVLSDLSGEESQLIVAKHAEAQLRLIIERCNSVNLPRIAMAADEAREELLNSFPKIRDKVWERRVSR